MYCITLRPREARAIYAAAGAVVGHSLGNVLGRVEAKPRGSVVISGRSWPPEGNNGWIHRVNLAQVAGHVAEELHGELDDPEAFALKLTQDITGLPHDPYFLGLVATSRDILLDRWNDVERIAEALKARETLQPRDIKHFLGERPGHPMARRR